MITNTQVLVVSRKTNGRCFYCNSPAQEIDHFIPKSLWLEKELTRYGYGSVDAVENLFAACRNCNRKKCSKHPSDFAGNGIFKRQYRANKRVGIRDIFGELAYG